MGPYLVQISRNNRGNAFGKDRSSLLCYNIVACNIVCMNTVETKITGTLVTETAKYNLKIIYHLLARPRVNINRDLNAVPPLYHDDSRCTAWHHRLDLADTNLIAISTENYRV